MKKKQIKQKNKSIISNPKITTITYRRIKNLGNYENEQLEATTIVSSGSANDELYKLKLWVNTQLGITKKSSSDHCFTCTCDECM